ncbi:hypothetical protein ACQ4M4_03175 [Leptolyngbya sp. AN02str]|uniref:hypothetical protein n=1 Tax=Leptolyngbya sp. AN02str TaxID=3423363 RepID=UPI003D315BC2
MLLFIGLMQPRVQVSTVSRRLADTVLTSFVLLTARALLYTNWTITCAEEWV